MLTMADTASDAGSVPDSVPERGPSPVYLRRAIEKFALDRRPAGQARPLSDEQVAKFFGLSRPYVTKLRTGSDPNPTYGVIVRLCQVMQCRPEDFFDPVDMPEWVRAQMAGNAGAESPAEQLGQRIEAAGLTLLASRLAGLNKDDIRVIEEITERLEKGTGPARQLPGRPKGRDSRLEQDVDGRVRPPEPPAARGDGQ
jgi:transcriptional regulator with XRE-family HTH domain